MPNTPVLVNALALDRHDSFVGFAMLMVNRLTLVEARGDTGTVRGL